ncbi:MAG: NAD kinase [Bacteroidales bacterium]|nr:NAD kinase [Candidatus Minthousia equi]
MNKKQNSAKSLKFALFGNTYQPKKSAAVQQLLSLLEQKGAEVFIDQEFYTFLTTSLHLDVKAQGLISDNDFDVDIVISMGGDGTFLKAASRVSNKEIPIVGINMGRLGFLADISPDEIENMVCDLYDGNYGVEKRSVLHTRFINSTTGEEIPCKTYPYALNDIAILKHDSSSMISIRTLIDDSFLTTYQADGIVIATPTGSTAYSLSVGGPILEPMSRTIGLTPVAPHSLNVRPVVLRDDSNIQMNVTSRSHNYLVAIDGRSASYPEDTELHISKANYSVLVIKRQGQSFYQTLREKMMWGADNRD